MNCRAGASPVRLGSATEAVALHFALRVDRRHDCLLHVNVAPVELSQCFLVFTLITLELGACATAVVGKAEVGVGVNGCRP